jgi:hypothetical protein
VKRHSYDPLERLLDVRQALRRHPGQTAVARQARVPTTTHHGGRLPIGRPRRARLARPPPRPRCTGPEPIPPPPHHLTHLHLQSHPHPSHIRITTNPPACSHKPDPPSTARSTPGLLTSAAAAPAGPVRPPAPNTHRPYDLSNDREGSAVVYAARPRPTRHSPSALSAAAPRPANDRHRSLSQSP